MTLLLLSAGVWPLEIKTLLVVFLGKELQRCRRYIFSMTGNFSLHIDGHCYWRNSEFQVGQITFQCPLGFVLEVGELHNVKRIPLMFDAFPAQDFRHISRICLELKG
ncbi:hypothetical protein LRP49_17180 [Enterovibrio sp. ZSDZ35]|uniref:Galectin n=1 Tax=Enterovibrio qingdaonensis TaxID=2899818 RepID=A0ABT5QQN9_9GAMM|nr:hypothetical protein [Enterovibrio sp. ZSDZ35]